MLARKECAAWYRWTAGEDHKLKVELRPLIASRDYHNTTHENGALDRHIGVAPGVVFVAPYTGLPSLYMAHTGASVTESGDWYRNFEYEALSRGSAYHQGTVWHWLIGPFLPAYVKVFGDAAIPQAKSWLACLEQHLSAEGLGQVSEVFGADPPHRAGGCIAQAWSVAELLRVRSELEHAVVATHPGASQQPAKNACVTLERT